RSLSADVIRILQDDLGLLLRGELIWQKAEGATGSCAWGSYRSASNPVLRDLTERVVVASKGRFDRARSVRARAAAGLPHESTLAEARLEDAGFTIVARNHKVPRTGVAVSLLATDASGERWYFDVAGAFTSYRGGLLRMDAVWKALGRAHALRGQVHRVPLVLL